MGCDIHFYVERRQGAKWVTADKWGVGKYSEPGDPPTVDYEDAFYSGRSYALFGILAGVRNHGYVPIAQPRGVPEDASPEFKAMVERWDGDGHSHSWLTMAEILAYDWTQTVQCSGWVDFRDWARWRDYGKPENWCGSVGGGFVRHLSPDKFEDAWVKLRTAKGYPEVRHASAHLYNHGDAEDQAEFLRLIGGGSPYCEVTWTVPYHEYTAEFWAHTIPRLLRLGSPEDVRMVFYFDN